MWWVYIVLFREIKILFSSDKTTLLHKIVEQGNVVVGFPNVSVGVTFLLLLQHLIPLFCDVCALLWVWGMNLAFSVCTRSPKNIICGGCKNNFILFFFSG